MILARTVAIISSAERETGGDQELFGLGQPIEAIDLASGWARRIMTSRGSVCDAQRPSSGVADDGPDDRFVGRFQVSKVGPRRKRTAACVYGGQGSLANRR